jgi:2-polyprenyl-3-methyl-5-hydroxy-6-metoxy-1,4-benzoquinol methylase
MKETKCICCGKKEWRLILGTLGKNYACCKSCNYYLQYEEANLSAKEKFEEEQTKFYDGKSLLLSPLFKYLQQEATNRRFKVCQQFLSEGKIIEVGPGNGDVLEKAIQLGYKVEAVEHSEKLASTINDRLGINIKIGAFEDQDFGSELYDAYMSFHVIEHVPEVIPHLEKANKVVKLGGYAFIATPNADSWEQKMPFNLSPNYSTAHLQLFSINALTLCLEKTGWEVIEVITPEYGGSWLRVATGIIRKLKGNSKENSIKRGEYIKSFNPKVKTFVQFFNFISFPFRKFQELNKRGNELFIVARKIS